MRSNSLVGRRNRLGAIWLCAVFFVCTLAGSVFAETQRFRHVREVSTTSPPQAKAATVRHVVDGDTLVLEDGVTVRLIGIDAPEVDHPRYGKIGEPFGPESAEFLRGLVEGKAVRLEAGAEPEDKYHRRLAYVYRKADNLFVNRRMVEAGYAETYRRFDFKYKKEFLKLEAKARQQRMGMWTESPDSWNQQFLHWMSMRQPRRKTASVSSDR